VVSSLELGTFGAPWIGPRVAPPGTGSSFLAVGTPVSTRGAYSFRDAALMALGAVGSPIQQIEASVPDTVPGGQSPPVGQYDISRFSEGSLTAATIAAMHRAVLEAKADADWRRWMEDIRRLGRTQGAIGWKDYLGEALWFDHWYRGPHFIDYVRDQHQIEMVQSPLITYEKQLGDCLPLEEKVILRHRETNAYVVLRLAEIKERFFEYDAISYSAQDGRFEFAPITAWTYKGRRPLIRVRARNGVAFRCTPDHRISGIFNRGARFQLDFREVSRVASLGHGYFRGIACARKIPALHSVNTIPAHQLYVEGMYVAEGYSEYPSKAEISNKSPDIIAKLKSCLETLGVPYRTRIRKDGVQLVYVKASSLSVRLHNLFGADSYSKQFPDEYLSLSQEDIETALSAYADGDAYHTTRRRRSLRSNCGSST